MTKPWRVLAMLVVPLTKTWTWLALLVPLGFLPLRSPYSLLGLPIMAERMLASREYLWTTHFHYNAPVWIIACMASVDAVSRLPRGWTAKPCAAVRKSLRGKGKWMKIGPLGGASILLVLCLLIGSATTHIFPFERMITGAAFTLTPETRARKEVVEWLPASTCVVADDRIAGQLTHSNRVTVPGISEHRQDFYVLDFSQPEPAATPAMWTTDQAYDFAVGLGFREVFESGTIHVLQAPDYVGPDQVKCGPDSP